MLAPLENPLMINKFSFLNEKQPLPSPYRSLAALGGFGSPMPWASCRRPSPLVVFLVFFFFLGGGGGTGGKAESGWFEVET